MSTFDPMSDEACNDGRSRLQIIRQRASEVICALRGHDPRRQEMIYPEAAFCGVVGGALQYVHPELGSVPILVSTHYRECSRCGRVGAIELNVSLVLPPPAKVLLNPLPPVSSRTGGSDAPVPDHRII